jgi:Glyoxalase-like domain
MELDHVFAAVEDLEAAADELMERHGLLSVEGGRHPGWGTQNRIVPLGDTYLELVAVVDEDEASRSAFGRWVARRVAEGGGLAGWVVRTDDLDAVAEHLGLTPAAGSRARSDGTLVRWRSAGIEEAAAEPSLPFFIEWAPDAPLPGRAIAQPDAWTVESLELRGDPDMLSSWLGVHELPVQVQPGSPQVTGLVLFGARGTVILS